MPKISTPYQDYKTSCYAKGKIPKSQAYYNKHIAPTKEKLRAFIPKRSLLKDNFPSFKNRFCKRCKVKITEKNYVKRRAICKACRSQEQKEAHNRRREKKSENEYTRQKIQKAKKLIENYQKTIKTHQKCISVLQNEIYTIQSECKHDYEHFKANRKLCKICQDIEYVL